MLQVLRWMNTHVIEVKTCTEMLRVPMFFCILELRQFVFIEQNARVADFVHQMILVLTTLSWIFVNVQAHRRTVG